MIRIARPEIGKQLYGITQKYNQYQIQMKNIIKIGTGPRLLKNYS